MIIVDGALVSEEIFEKKFVCDLGACKGACCVEGESGAPLEAGEVGIIEDALPEIKPFMRKEGIEVIDEMGVFEIDSDGDYVTPLIKGKECAFVNFDNRGTAKCSIEMAYRAGKIDFPKPVSCHLYPIRLTELKDFTAVNYHYWPICDPARACGAKLDVKVYRFLKEPIIRKFGSEFYDRLNAADELLSSNSDVSD
jgi:hypothetical protein